MTTRKVLQNPSVRRLMLSTVFAALGINILITVLFKQVFDLTRDELDIGLIGLAQFIPAVLLVLVSGWAADRFDRRHVTALFIGGRVMCAIALAVYSQTDSQSMGPFLMIAFVLGAVDAMLSPARRALQPLIVETRDLPSVVALWTAAFTGASILGPVAGGFLYSVGPSNAYLVAAVLEFLAVLPLFGIRYASEPQRNQARPTLATAMEGLVFVRRTPVVLAAISLDLFAVLFGGAIALIPAVATERLGVGDIAYGWLRAAPGVGAAAMAVWLALRPVRRRVGPTLLAVVAVFGAGTVVFGVTRNYAVAFIALVVISAADMVSMFIRGSLVPLATPADQLGRVSAVESLFIGASNELGAFESGVAARAFGLSGAIAFGGIMTLVVAAGFALTPTVRNIDTFDDVVPKPPRKPEPVG